MALAHLCYRCPCCGRDPTTGKGNRVRCGACGARVERRGGRLLLAPPAPARPRQVTAAFLAREIEGHGGPMTRATRPDGSVRYSASARISWRAGQRAVRWKGRLLGFAESTGKARSGVVTAGSRSIAVEDPVGVVLADYLDIRALQGTSACIQIALSGDRLVEARFDADSPRRWESLLRRMIRDAYARAGLGAVVEFQPRVSAKRSA